MNLPLKDYQRQLLDDFAAFLARTRELGDPAPAFAESTQAHFGHALPYHPLPGAEKVPYVCLRVPTGGGKTRIAGQAIRRVTGNFLATHHALVLWLVPSETIRDQTLQALKTPGALLHQDMRDLFGSVHVLSLDEALYLQPATLDTATTIIVTTMQSLKRDTPEGLRAYRQNGYLMAHFPPGCSAEQKGEGSLVDVIRLRRPFVIVDEAHNQGTPLAMETLVRLDPACVLELTATPDRIYQPSNVLRSVSAATLQAEDMLKLPLELAVHANWRVSLREAIARLRQLEQEAEAEKRLTGEVIQPVVMLIQAERQLKAKETLTPQRLKQHLIEDFQIPAEDIAIATGKVDELAGRKLGDPDYPRFIITVDKLREGWDCPNAYVLFSLRNTTSATAVEQVLGRILRMPQVTRKQREALNRCYAYVVSEDFVATVKGLRDGLVQNGFERLEAKDLITTSADQEPMEDLFTPAVDLVVPLPERETGQVMLPDGDALAVLPKSLRDKVEISPEAGTLTVKGSVKPEQIQKIAATFKQPEAMQAIRERLDRLQSTQRSGQAKPTQSPAERGETAKLPLLAIRQQGFFDVFDETPLLDADWEITDFDPKLTETEFSKDLENARRAELTISQSGEIECHPYELLDSQLALFDREAGWQRVDLVYWLDRNIRFPYADQDQKVAWLDQAVSHLLEARAFTLEELAYRKFELRRALEHKLVDGLQRAKQKVFDRLLEDESRFEVRDEPAIVFQQGRYAYDYPYAGLIPLKRHFFPVIGNLRDSGEEFECAEFIANRLEGVEWWVRNVEKKSTSFWLQTSSGRFYPDFVVRMQNGVFLVVEYKGKHLADNRDSQEKKRIGALWARRSGGRCRFAWVEERQWQSIRDVLR